MRSYTWGFIPKKDCTIKVDIARAMIRNKDLIIRKNASMNDGGQKSGGNKNIIYPILDCKWVEVGIPYVEDREGP
jgi:hypothetical protein